VEKASEIPSPCNQVPNPGEAGIGRARGEAKGVERRVVQNSLWNLFSDLLGNREYLPRLDPLVRILAKSYLILWTLLH